MPYAKQILKCVPFRIGLQGITVLDYGISLSHSIIDLNLSGCQIRDDGGVIVANAMKINDICKVLDLGHNLLYINSARELGQMLRVNKSLDILELGWNNFYGKGCIPALFLGLRKNADLKEIGLSFNGLSGDEFGTELRKTLMRNKTLKKITLENNGYAIYGD